MTQTYGFATDGMFYHVSQVTVDERGRWVPRPGAHPGQIAKPTEFGEMPEIPEAAAAMLKAWNAGQPAAEAEEPLPTTYDTKVVTPAAAAADVLTKDEAASRDYDTGRAKALRGEK